MRLHEPGAPGEQRHSCDYDPDYRINRQEALDAIALAEAAIQALDHANPVERMEFFAGLLFESRR